MPLFHGSDSHLTPKELLWGESSVTGKVILWNLLAQVSATALATFFVYLGVTDLETRSNQVAGLAYLILLLPYCLLALLAMVNFGSWVYRAGAVEPYGSSYRTALFCNSMVSGYWVWATTAITWLCSSRKRLKMQQARSDNKS